MTSVLLSPCPDERWRDSASPGRRSAVTPVLLLASLAFHAGVVGTAVVAAGQADVPLRQEIAVEIVQESAKPASDLPALAKPPKIATSDSTKPEPMKTERFRSEPPRPAAAKIERAKPETAERDTRKPRSVAKADARAETLEALESELEKLKAEHAALEAARAPASRETGLGPLPDSFQAVALPAVANGLGEVVGYQEIVFSALAKAKGIRETQGLPGTAGVHFEIDASGRLVGAEIVHKSGVPSLDAEALAIVRKAAPFPPPPQGAQRGFDANVSFVAESER